MLVSVDSLSSLLLPLAALASLTLSKPTFRYWKWVFPLRGSRREYSRAATERKVAPPVADAAAWSSNEAQSSDSFSWLNDNAELWGK